MTRRVPTSLQFFERLKWIDGRPLLDVVEPYRQRIFRAALDSCDGDGRPDYNLVLRGASKKNWKSADLVLAASYRFFAWDSPGGNQCFLLANDWGQAADDLELEVKFVTANPILRSACVITKNRITRKDGRGFLEILPAGDYAGAHGKTYCFCGFDEIHGYRDWNILEAMQHDPSRPDALMWITSYASIYHKPGVPLFDLCKIGREGRDPRMLFAWHAADYTTDPNFADADPETRANPSRASWADPDYLNQQRRRLPAHKFRRLHLNLPGLPDGSAFQPEPIMEAIDRTWAERSPERDHRYQAFVDLSGGSSDDAVLAIGEQDADGRAVVVRALNQGPPPPFAPRLAVERFVAELRRYGVPTVTGDAYAGQTFQADFARHGIGYAVSDLPTSKLYEALEPYLNGRQAILPNVPTLEQQLLGLIWRGGKIDHPGGEHDDFANAVAGVIVTLMRTAGCDYSCGSISSPERRERARIVSHFAPSTARHLGRRWSNY
jgi:hypothetical protein